MVFNQKRSLKLRPRRQRRTSNNASSTILDLVQLIRRRSRYHPYDVDNNDNIRNTRTLRQSQNRLRQTRHDIQEIDPLADVDHTDVQENISINISNPSQDQSKESNILTPTKSDITDEGIARNTNEPEMIEFDETLEKDADQTEMQVDIDTNQSNTSGPTLYQSAELPTISTATQPNDRSPRKDANHNEKQINNHDETLEQGYDTFSDTSQKELDTKVSSSVLKESSNSRSNEHEINQILPVPDDDTEMLNDIATNESGPILAQSAELASESDVTNEGPSQAKFKELPNISIHNTDEGIDRNQNELKMSKDETLQQGNGITDNSSTEPETKYSSAVLKSSSISSPLPDIDHTEAQKDIATNKNYTIQDEIPMVLPIWPETSKDETIQQGNDITDNILTQSETKNSSAVLKSSSISSPLPHIDHTESQKGMAENKSYTTLTQSAELSIISIATLSDNTNEVNARNQMELQIENSDDILEQSKTSTDNLQKPENSSPMLRISGNSSSNEIIATDERLSSGSCIHDEIPMVLPIWSETSSAESSSNLSGILLPPSQSFSNHSPASPIGSDTDFNMIDQNSDEHVGEEAGGAGDHNSSLILLTPIISIATLCDNTNEVNASNQMELQFKNSDDILEQSKTSTDNLQNPEISDILLPPTQSSSNHSPGSPIGSVTDFNMIDQNSDENVGEEAGGAGDHNSSLILLPPSQVSSNHSPASPIASDTDLNITDQNPDENVDVEAGGDGDHNNTLIQIQITITASNDTNSEEEE